jgi:hypothetical protein
MKTKFLFIALTVTSMLFFTGCFSVDNNFKSIRNITLKECGRNYATDSEFALGSFELWLADGIVSFTDADKMAKDILDNISGVQVGIYKRKSDVDLNSKELLKKIDRQMKREGLVYIVKSFDKDNVSAVYINKDHNKMLRELFVVDLNDNEITVVQLTGNLEKVIEIAIREEGLYNIIDKEDMISNK